MRFAFIHHGVSSLQRRTQRPRTIRRCDGNGILQPAVGVLVPVLVYRVVESDADAGIGAVEGVEGRARLDTVIARVRQHAHEVVARQALVAAQQETLPACRRVVLAVGVGARGQRDRVAGRGRPEDGVVAEDGGGGCSGGRCRGGGGGG